MNVAAKLDDFGRPAWIGLTVLGFVVYWPVGLAILLFSLWSGRMGCWNHGRNGRWHRDGGERMSDRMGRWCGGSGRRTSSGNRAFDEYRGETLRRLEAEQREFLDFLERLRQAKDKAEFDQFMSERGPHPEPTAV
jgi:Protein of unknown function (DUF2852)